MRKFATASVGALAFALVSCGGDGTSNILGGSGSGGSGGGGGGGGTTPTYSMGNGSGAGFQPGVIGISSASVSAGGTTSLSVSIVDKTGALYTTATSVTFSSPCLAQGLATLTASGTSTPGATAGSVSTNTGIADGTYTAKGCSGSDVITATATVSSANLSASGTVTVGAATIGSIKFISAMPATVGLKGTGIGSTSTVIFEVDDSSGGPVPGATVNFTLNTSVGGLSLAPTSAVSGTNGQVQTVVSAGTVHTTVRVTATIASPAVSTQSSILTISTGIPVAGNSFTIAVGAPKNFTAPACPNIESYGIQGIQVPITAQLNDRYHNPVPDGTSVAFLADGGSVGPSCTTPLNPGDGRCQVLWTSSGQPATMAGPPNIAPPIKADGRTGILATAIGEEAFLDVAGTGFYQSPPDTFTPSGEPYLDENENGQYDSGEQYLDFNKNGSRDGPGGQFVGITCNGILPSSTCTTSTLAIGASLLLIETTGGAIISLVSPATPISFAPGSSGAITFNVRDLHGNPIAAGSSIAISASQSIGKINSLTTSFTMGCSTSLGGDNFTTYLDAVSPLPTGVTSVSGSVFIQVTSPESKTVSLGAIPVTVQ